MPNDRPEEPAVATRAVFLTAISLFVFVAISLVVLHVYYREQINRAVFVPPTPFTKPHLQTDDARDLAKLQAAQQGRLVDYAWVDRGKGIISIPVEEAMKRTVARGTDAYGPIDPSSATQQPAAPDGERRP
jgi:hypothetical protein